jgi:hypothetical protein
VGRARAARSTPASTTRTTTSPTPCIPYGTPQADNGILDTYVDRVKFGLMTFDAHPTYTPFGALIPHASFNETLSDGVRGAFSYADSRGFRYFGCPDNNDRRVNSGARSETAARVGSSRWASRAPTRTCRATTTRPSTPASSPR